MSMLFNTGHPAQTAGMQIRHWPAFRPLALGPLRAALSALLLMLLLLAGCAGVPQAPSVTVMPGVNKPLDVFTQEDRQCRDWAVQSVGVAGQGAAGGAVPGEIPSASTGWEGQRRYDIAYLQCMYSKGNVVPVYSAGSYRYMAAPTLIPPAPGGIYRR